jgi:hypothetical protein
MPICSAGILIIEVSFDIVMEFILSLYHEISNDFFLGQLIGFPAGLFFFLFQLKLFEVNLQSE